MKYNIFKLDNNDFYLLITIISCVFIINYIYPYIITQNKKEEFELDNKINDIVKNVSTYYDNSKLDNLPRIDKNICSKQCCKFIQWPVPFNTRNPVISDETLNKYIGSNLSCNLGEGGGCVCVTKDDYNYLANHGQNN